MYLRSSCCIYPHSIIPIPSWWHTRETTLVTVCTCTRSPSTHTQLYPFHPTWTTVCTCTRSPSTHTQLRHTCETTWMTVYTCTRSHLPTLNYDTHVKLHERLYIHVPDPYLPHPSILWVLQSVIIEPASLFQEQGQEIRICFWKCFQKHASGAVGGDVLYPSH